jgi:hypothetical protein
VGIYDYIRFAGHNQYDQRVYENSVTGTGSDLILSYHNNRFLPLTASVGAYYFDMPEHPLGIIAKLASPIRHHLSFSLSVTHDPLSNNSVNFGISAHIGNDTDESGAWINKPVQHDLPLNVGANSIPIRNSYQADGTELLQKDNVWFFSTDGSAYNSSQGLANCTAENPCSGLNSANLLQIASDAAGAGFTNDPSIYLKPGTYTPSVLLLYGNESLIGRTADYKQNATGNNRALLTTGSLLIDGQVASYNTLANLQLVNDGNLLSAIEILNTKSTTIDNVLIGPNTPSDSNQNYYSDLNISGAENVAINNSTLNANNVLAGTALSTSNILVENTSNLTINNSTLNDTATGVANQGATGIAITGASAITINNSTLNDTASGNLNAGATGIYITDDSSIALNHSILNQNGTGTDTRAINIFDSGNHTVNVSIDNSALTGTTASTESNIGVFNIILSNNSTLNVSNSSIVGRSTSVNGLGATINLQLSNQNAATTDSTNATITNSLLFSSGVAATQTGSTNISTVNNATATVNSSHLETDMAGGPEITEASGAVPLWALNTSKITVNDSIVIAKALNSDTIATPVQAQGGTNQAAIININNSQLYAYSLYGNTTHSDSSAVVAGFNSKITLNSTGIHVQTSGASDHNTLVINAIGDSQITLNNSSLVAENGNTPISGTLNTVGFSAINNAIIYNNGTSLDLNGNNIKVEQTFDNGQVINQ